MTTLAEIQEQYIGLADAAVILGVTVQTVRRIVKNGELTVVPYAGRYLIEREAVFDFKPAYHPVPHRRRRTRGRLL